MRAGLGMRFETNNERTPILINYGRSLQIILLHCKLKRRHKLKRRSCETLNLSLKTLLNTKEIISIEKKKIFVK